MKHMLATALVAMVLVLRLAGQSPLFLPPVDGPGNPGGFGDALLTPAIRDRQAVPRSFRAIALGMNMDQVKDALMSDSLFSYRGEPDVSLLPRPNESLIEVSGLSYVRRAFFQFHEDRLFVMIFTINERKMDHYAIFTSLSAKYGKPDSLSPSESVWNDAATRLSIERPLAIKYIDLTIFDALRAAGQAEQSMEEILRSEFLDGL
jgi:hypothetical protein